MGFKIQVKRKEAGSGQVTVYGSAQSLVYPHFGQRSLQCTAIIAEPQISHRTGEESAISDLAM